MRSCHNLCFLFQLTSGQWAASWPSWWLEELFFQEMIVRKSTSSYTATPSLIRDWMITITLENLMWQISEIDQITKVLKLCGTPTNETLSKITSEEVRKIYMKKNSHISFLLMVSRFHNLLTTLLFIKMKFALSFYDFQISWLKSLICGNHIVSVVNKGIRSTWFSLFFSSCHQCRRKITKE